MKEQKLSRVKANLEKVEAELTLANTIFNHTPSQIRSGPFIRSDILINNPAKDKAMQNKNEAQTLVDKFKQLVEKEQCDLIEISRLLKS